MLFLLVHDISHVEHGVDQGRGIVIAETVAGRCHAQMLHERRDPAGLQGGELGEAVVVVERSVVDRDEAAEFRPVEIPVFFRVHAGDGFLRIPHISGVLFPHTGVSVIRVAAEDTFPDHADKENGDNDGPQCLFALREKEDQKDITRDQQDIDENVGIGQYPVKLVDPSHEDEFGNAHYCDIDSVHDEEGTQPELFFKDRMEPFESHIEQKEAVYEGVTVRQIRRKMKTVDHEIQRLDACAEKHEDHEYGEKDLLSLVSFLIKKIHGQEDHGEHTGVDVGKVLISRENGSPCSEKMVCDELPDIGIDLKIREARAAHLGLGQCKGDRGKNECGCHGGADGNDREPDEAKKHDFSVLLRIKVREQKDQTVEADQDADQDGQIKVDDHGEGEADIVEHFPLPGKQPLKPQNNEGEEDDRIQPHDIPVKAGHIGRKTVQKSEEQYTRIVLSEMLLKIIRERGGAETDLDHDEDGDRLRESCGREPEVEQIQRRGRVVGCLGQKIFPQSAFPAVEEALAVRDPAPHFLEIRGVLVEEIDAQDRTVSERKNVQMNVRDKKDHGACQKGNEHKTIFEKTLLELDFLHEDASPLIKV